MKLFTPIISVSAVFAAFAGAEYMVLSHKPGQVLEQGVHIDCFDEQGKSTGSADVPKGYAIQNGPIVTRITEPGFANYSHHDLLGACRVKASSSVKYLKIA